MALAPRLTVHPEYVLDPERWLDPAVRFAVMDRSDAEGLGRDDPGAVFVQRLTPASPEQVDDGVEVAADRPPLHPVVLRRQRRPARAGARAGPAPPARCARCSTA